jgi:hypothetical protein
MATTDLRQANGNGNGQDAPPYGPSDREVVEALQRIASAQAHLRLAESRAAEEHDPAIEAQLSARNREIELAHAELLWSQAALLSTRRNGKVEQDAIDAAARERSILTRHGFSSFRDYLQQRNAVPTTDTHLALARREFGAAQAAWQQLQRAMAPTMIIDLTGDEPRIL